MRLRVLTATVAAFLACLSIAQAATAPRILTLRDSGEKLVLHRGARLQLHLPERFRWLAPRIRGTSVRVTRIAFFRDPGYVAWSIVARSRGTAVVSTAGYPAGDGRSCDPGICAARLFRITLVVR
jgi:hypothetical protein